MDADRLLRLLDRADLADNQRMQELVRIVSQTGGTRTAEYAEQLITHRVSQQLQYPFSVDSYPLATVPGPEQLYLGNVIGTARQFTLEEQVLRRHVEIAGATGTGKTTLLYQLLTGTNAPFWAFDRKQDYRQLLHVQPDVLVLPWERLGLNPLIPPPGVSLRLWTWVFAELFGHVHALLSASKNRLKYDLATVYRDHGFELHPRRYSEDLIREVVAGTRSMPPDPRPDPANVTYPTMVELQQQVEDGGDGSYKDRQYGATVANRMRDVTDVAGPLFTADRNPPLEQLMTQKVVWEFGQLGADIQNFLMEYLLVYVYTYRLANDLRDEDAPLLMFVIDEAKRLFSRHKEQQAAAGEPLANDLLEKVRGFNMALLIASQEPRKLTETVRANTYTKILFRLESGDERQVMANAMGLSKPQRVFAESTLDVGNALVSVGPNEAVPVAFTNVDTSEPVQYEELVASQYAQWDAVSGDPASDTSSSTVLGGAEQTEPTDTVSVADEHAEKPVTESPTQLSDEAAVLLQDVVEHEFRPVTERYPRVGGKKAGISAKQELRDNGFIREKFVTLQTGRMKLLELTDAGRTYLMEQGTEVSRVGRGGVVHRFWQYRVKHLLEEQGWTATREKADADVLAETGDRVVAVEVALRDRAREVEHVRDRLAAGADAVIVLGKTRAICEGLKQKLDEEGLLRPSVVIEVVRAFEGVQAVE
ncbi:ATP-binding protein [Halorarum salinum]|uniref:ATP-binding protein n=1 Tax=Halorarum salinum TaxID=2743089 RepID=A0A7D5LAN7_9EURY|nr:ATP-binding protein [Halobaculum salinum]QLG61971.1 ATP-binding protein [Halobaculum salinum]